MDEPQETERSEDDLEVHRRSADAYLRQGGDGSRCNDEGLRHLAAHLYALRDLPTYRLALYRLIDEPWMWARRAGRAWPGVDFLADVELAWQAAVSHDGKDLVLLVQLQTAREVVRYEASRYSDALLQALVWLDRADRAIEIARLRTGASNQFEGLLAIQEALAARGTPRPVLLAEAQALAADFGRHTPDRFDENARAVQRLAGAFAALGTLSRPTR